jgi:outer membrane protein TolC
MQTIRGRVVRACLGGLGLRTGVVATHLLLASCALPPDFSQVYNKTHETAALPVAGGASSTESAAASGEGPSITGTAELQKPTGIADLTQDGNLQLRACVTRALEHNLDVRLAKIDQRSAAAGIQRAKAAFDPAFSGTVASFPDGEGNTDTNLLLQKRFATGTDVRVEGGTVFFDNNDRTQGFQSSGTETAVRLRQPLLKGANWKVNQSPIEAARIIAKSADAATEAQIMEMLRAAESTYWTGSYAERVWHNEAEGLKRSQKVLDLVRSRLSAGAATQIDLLEAEAAQAMSREATVRSENRFKDTVAMLMQIAGYESGNPDPASRFASLTEAPPATPNPDAEASYERAMKQSPVVMLLANQITLKDIDLAKARNNLLPRMDLEFNFGTESLFASRQGSSVGSDAGNWNVLMRFSVPWTFREQKADLVTAQAELERSTVAKTQALRELKRQIFETCRQIVSGQTQLEAASRAAEVNKAKWEEQFRRYQEGIVSVRDLLLAEGEYRAAQSRELNARLQLVLADVLLARQEGTITDRNHLML